MKFFILITILISNLSIASNNRDTDSECAYLKYAKKRVNYCIYNKRSKSPDIIYYLHQAGGSHHSWGRSSVTRQFYKNLKTQGLEKPTVVSISLGSFWLMTDISDGKNKNLQDLFAENLVPYFESRIAKLKKVSIRQRYLLGASMGGYNSLVLALRKPDLFDRIAVACPALPLINQFSTQEEINSYIQETGADPRIVPYVLKIMRKEFKTLEDIQRNNPFELLNSNTQLLPPIYVTVGDKDEFGIFEAVRKFASLLTFKASEAIFKPIANGGHCSMDTAEVAKFLSDSTI